MGRCRGCGRFIVWVTTRAGKSMPCDPGVETVIPDPAGSVTVVTVDGQVIRGRPADPEDAMGVITRGRVPHWATCPQADAFRGREAAQP